MILRENTCDSSEDAQNKTEWIGIQVPELLPIYTQQCMDNLVNKTLPPSYKTLNTSNVYRAWW